MGPEGTGLAPPGQSKPARSEEPLENELEDGLIVLQSRVPVSPLDTNRTVGVGNPGRFELAERIDPHLSEPYAFAVTALNDHTLALSLPRHDGRM